MFSYVARVDRTLMFLNLLLLMVVAAIPWPTAMLAEYPREGRAFRVAAVRPGRSRAVARIRAVAAMAVATVNAGRLPSAVVATTCPPRRSAARYGSPPVSSARPAPANRPPPAWC
ncbi:hypothetical protein ACFYW8_36105 [Streptomyces sp. NPDC002742]|uniref:hypothetical protein n=1 Tax=Streptomyces sp. NPDC002742 TaxID=3364663 RepID=UPI0036898C34